MHVAIPVSPGELIDKITILEIKSERITEDDKLANVRTELALLREARDTAVHPSPELVALTTELKAVNGALWDIEDRIRRCERAGDFGPDFVQLARAVYRGNDRRASVKRRLNELLGADIVEEKAYARYE